LLRGTKKSEPKGAALSDHVISVHNKSFMEEFEKNEYETPVGIRCDLDFSSELSVACVQQTAESATWKRGYGLEHNCASGSAS
jgi:hypothetical protein